MSISSRALAAAGAVLALSSLASAEAAAAPSSAYVVIGEDGARVARVLTQAPACPAIVIDGRRRRMAVRAPAGVVPQRPTRSDPADSKPSAFDVLTCEAAVPARARSAAAAGRVLPLPPAVIRRIVVIGDTGCRLKKSDNAYQACNDPKAYPFAKVAAAAARWKPDLVIHVGDFLYRENVCAVGQPGCAGSSWGYGYDAWRADFFKPAAPLLRAAPWALVRGNHESCNRGGQGWWRFLDPRPLVAGRDCDRAENDDIGDYSDPYAVPLGEGYQLIIADSSNAPGKALAADDPRAAKYQDAYRKIDALAARAPHNIEAHHHPLLGFAISEGQGEPKLNGGNAALQSAWGPLNPRYVPTSIDLLLSGHVHVWEAVDFSSAHPAQIVAGFSGTLEDIVPLPAAPPPGATPAPGAVVRAMSSWVDGFGFITLERTGPERWRALVRDAAGTVVNRCRIEGPHVACELPQVPRR